MTEGLTPDRDVITDGAMGGSSTTETCKGRTAARLSGTALTKNNGGFLQMAFDIEKHDSAYDEAPDLFQNWMFPEMARLTTSTCAPAHLIRLGDPSGMHSSQKMIGQPPGNRSPPPGHIDTSWFLGLRNCGVRASWWPVGSFAPISQFHRYYFIIELFWGDRVVLAWPHQNHGADARAETSRIPDDKDT